MAHLSKGDYLSNYFHGTYRRYLPALTNAFTYRQNMCQENYRVCQAWRNLEYTLCYKNHRTWSSKNAATVLSWNCRTLQRIVWKDSFNLVSLVLKIKQSPVQRGHIPLRCFLCYSSCKDYCNSICIEGMSLSAATAKLTSPLTSMKSVMIKARHNAAV